MGRQAVAPVPPAVARDCIPGKRNVAGSGRAAPQRPLPAVGRSYTVQAGG